VKIRLAVMVGVAGFAVAGCGGGSTAAAGYSCADVQAAQTKFLAASSPNADPQAAVPIWNELGTSLYMFHSGEGAIRAAASASISAGTSLAPDAGDVAVVSQALDAASKTCK
jgi:hypothetical protein